MRVATIIYVLAAALSPVTALALPAAAGNPNSVTAALIPPFGITPGIKAADGSASCAGDKGIDIPCVCPPDLNTFVGAVKTFVAGGLPFPTSNSVADQLTRLNTLTVTLQNFRGGKGSGTGCPIVSTKWSELGKSLSAQQ